MPKVLVASRKEVKRLAVQQAFETYDNSNLVIELASDPVSSDVSDQPTTQEETARGARNRLAAIRKTSPDYDYWVAIEGGCYRLNIDGKSQWYDVTCAAVADDTAGEPIVGFGPSFPLPPNMAPHIEAGKTLNEAVEAVTGIPEIGNGQGFNGWFTNDQIDRQAGSSLAVLVALHGLEKAQGNPL